MAAVFDWSNKMMCTLALFLFLFTSVAESRASPKDLDPVGSRSLCVTSNAIAATRASTNELAPVASRSSCVTGNSIDDCWRCDTNWAKNRTRLAACAVGFGRNATGGRDGRLYIVTDPSDDDAVNPKKGTLRHAVIQTEPLWIVFERDMVINLKQELIMNSYKTIDGRGANVHIADGACITIQYVKHIIIHGLHIHGCKPTGNAMVRSTPSHYGWRGMADGDAVSIFGSTDIWIDHNSLSNCTDGLVDVVVASNNVTISNNHLSKHNEVMLFGHSDTYEGDKIMQVTVVYNHFGDGLTQRMPHCRHGLCHVVNNDYTHGWGIYAIGGAADPTIISEGNRFVADPKRYRYSNEVTKRTSSDKSEWKNWNWSSKGDLFMNGAYFVRSGAYAKVPMASVDLGAYAKASSDVKAKKSSRVGGMTAAAGALICRKNQMCSSF